MVLSTTADAQSYVVSVFFKSFALAVSMGLYHGLVVLPALLSVVGSASYEQRRVSLPSKTNVKSGHATIVVAALSHKDMPVVPLPQPSVPAETPVTSASELTP